MATGEVPAVLASVPTEVPGDGTRPQTWKDEVLAILHRLARQSEEQHEAVQEIQGRLKRLEGTVDLLANETRNNNSLVEQWSTRCLTRCEALERVLSPLEPEES